MDKFNEIMSKHSTKELMKIIEMKSDYQPEAVAAAELELKKRKELFDNGKIPIEQEEDFEFEILETFKKSTDDELISFYKVDFNKFSKIEIQFLNEELIKRKIEPQVWYYSKGNQKNGPKTATEIKNLAKNREIDHYDYIWREGLNNWIVACKVEGLFEKQTIPPPIGNYKPNWIVEEKKHGKPAGIIISAVIMFFTVPIWIFIALLQAGFSVMGNNEGIGFLAVWNFFFTIFSIALGIGFLQLKKWSYKWGLSTAIINILWFGYNYSNTNLKFFLVLLILELIIAILLFTNRKSFDKIIAKEEEVFI